MMDENWQKAKESLIRGRELTNRIGTSTQRDDKKA